MNELLEFLNLFENGATEDQICKKFPKLKKIELAATLNSLLQSNRIEIATEDGKIYYKAVLNRICEYEQLVINSIEKAGSTGLWLRDIKTKTNIPHNLILKILKNLENSKKIKSIKSIKNNRKTYVLYDILPDEDLTGGVWFSNNDVDLIFVNKLMDIICRFVKRREESHTLNKINSLARVNDVLNYIKATKISEIELSLNDINILIDCLVFDMKIERFITDDGIALRVLPENFLNF